MDVILEKTDQQWYFMGLYGWPEEMNEDYTWALIRQLNGHNSFPWLCVGDFNELFL